MALQHGSIEALAHLKMLLHSIQCWLLPGEKRKSAGKLWQLWGHSSSAGGWVHTSAPGGAGQAGDGQGPRLRSWTQSNGCWPIAWIHIGPKFSSVLLNLSLSFPYFDVLVKTVVLSALLFCYVLSFSSGPIAIYIALVYFVFHRGSTPGV